MANRYWVGGSGTWNTTSTTNWSASSGGAGGASVPTASDAVIFDGSSGTGTVTLSGAIRCASFDARNLSSNVSFSGSHTLIVSGSFYLSGFVIWNSTSTVTLSGPSAITYDLAAYGASAPGLSLTISSSGTYLLGSALSCSTLTVSSGGFNTGNYNLTATSISSPSTFTRTINFGSSTITLSSATAPLSIYTSLLTFNAGTSSVIINGSSSSMLFNPTTNNGLTMYDVSFTGVNNSVSFSSANSFRNLSFAARNSAGINSITLADNQTVTGTLSISASGGAAMRTFIASNLLGTTRTLTCAAVSSLSDIDFRDIAVSGAAAPISGTRFGDCKGNSGITFPAAKTFYWNLAAGGQWGANAWASTSGGTPSLNNFPLAQDTAIIEATGLNSGATITMGVPYNISTVDMSARTSNTMTLATSTTALSIYGNWINGTGVTITGTGILTFAGRTTQTVSSAGKTWPQRFTITTPGGSVVLQDALVLSNSSSQVITLTQGTFDANIYNVTLSGSAAGVLLTGTSPRSIGIGSGTWTIAGTSVWTASTATNLTVTGTGTISLTSASAKTFAGGGIAYTNITLNQGGAGALTITGSNTFKDITNTYSATGATTITFTSGTTTTLSQFTATGASGKVLTIGASTTSQATLTKPSTWYMGANSTDGGNNTGLTFTAGGGIDYLSVSYIKGQGVAGASQLYYGSTKITNLKFGSTTVSAVYYGSTKVF